MDKEEKFKEVDNRVKRFWIKEMWGLYDRYEKLLLLERDKLYEERDINKYGYKKDENSIEGLFSEEWIEYLDDDIEDLLLGFEGMYDDLESGGLKKLWEKYLLEEVVEEYTKAIKFLAIKVLAVTSLAVEGAGGTER